MNRNLKRRGPLLALAAFLLAAPAAASDRPTLVVWLRPGPPDPTPAVRAQLDAREFDLAPATWTTPRSVLHFADPRRPRTDAQVFDTLNTVRALPGVLAAGELLSDDGIEVRFWSGRVAVRFIGPTLEVDARSAGDALGLGAHERMDREGEVYLFDAELRPAGLAHLQASATLFSSIDWLEPVDFIANNPGRLFPPFDGRYHQIPKDRNVVTVLLTGLLIDTGVQNVITAHGGIVDDIGTATDRWINIAFHSRNPAVTHEEEMEIALAQLLAIEDEVVAAGPAILGGPPAFLDEQLVVRYASEMDRYMAAPLLDTFGKKGAGFTSLRRLPYIEDGDLLRFNEGASYQIYDAARKLIMDGRALYAIPNFVTVNTNACGLNCFGGTTHQHLNTMDVCEPREGMPEDPDDWNVRMAVLDDGANCYGNTLPTPGERVQVDRLIDFETMETCEPDAPLDWCDENCKSLVDPWTGPHGSAVSMAAAATHDGKDDDLVGIAPGLKVINARRPMQEIPTGSGAPTEEEWDLMMQVALADGLWWLAGGDPEWCCDGTMYPCTAIASCFDPCTGPTGMETDPCLPDPIPSGYAADVINMSFTREDFLTKLSDCSSSHLCTLVCDDPKVCGIIEETLTELDCPDCGHGMRTGGTVVAAAVGDVARTDLAAVATTVAVGSVEWNSSESSWLPFYDGCSAGYCWIHNPGSFVDTVGPFGQGDGVTVCDACIPGSEVWRLGASSGATAGVSATAAMMLQTNRNLTAAQVQCILRATAQRSGFTDPTGWKAPGCEWVATDFGIHSECLGYGMVNTCEAVAAAEACEDPDSADCPAGCAVESSTTTPTVEDDEVGDDESDDEDCDAPKGGKKKKKKKTKPSRPIDVGKLIHVVRDGKLSPVIRDLLRCLIDESCSCDGRSECLELELVHEGRRTLRDRQVMLCFGKRCWPVAAPIDRWKPGQTLRVPLRPEAGMAGYIKLGVPARIEIVPAEKRKAPVEQSKR